MGEREKGRGGGGGGGGGVGMGFLAGPGGALAAVIAAVLLLLGALALVRGPLSPPPLLLPLARWGDCISPRGRWPPYGKRRICSLRP